jgi:hypothetical protein
MFDLLPFLVSRRPRTFAPYYEFGAEYVRTVARQMGFEEGTADRTMDEAYRAMDRNQTGVEPPVARSIASVLIGDARWYGALAEWLPLPARVWTRGRGAPLVLALESVGRGYADGLDSFDAPSFSGPEDVLVDGRPAVDYVDERKEQLVLATSILHLEWFVQVAERHGIDVPVYLVDRTRAETKRYFTGVSDELSDDVREFQYWLFEDIEWVEKFERHYGGPMPGTSEDAGVNPVLERVRQVELS